MTLHLLAASGDNSSSAIYVILTGVVCTVLGWWLRKTLAHPSQEPVQTPLDSVPGKLAQLEEKLATVREETAAAKLGHVEAARKNAALESRANAAEAAREKAERERDTLRARADAAEEIHRRSAQRESEHQKVLDSLAAAELNLKGARIAESQAQERAAIAEAALTRSESGPGLDPELLAAVEKQLGETRRLLQDAEADAATQRLQLAESRAQLTALAGDEALAALRRSAARAEDDKRAACDRTAQIQRELDSALTRITQLEAAAVTLQSKISGPPPELAEAKADAARTRVALKFAEDATAKVRQELDAVAARARGLESTLNATRQASASLTSTGADLAEALRTIDSLKDDIKSARDEIRKLKNDAPHRKPRPILTSPRPASSPPVQPGA